MATSNLDELQHIGLLSLHRHLGDQIRGYGTTPHIAGDRLELGRVGDFVLTCRCFMLETPPGVPAAITPVAIDLTFQNADAGGIAPPLLTPQTPRIGEIVVGIAEDKREAVVQATHNWSEGVFPAILRAFDTQPASEEDKERTHRFQIATQDVQRGTTQDWDLFLGPPQIGGTVAGRDAFGAFVSSGKLVHLLLNALTGLAGDVRLHWVKVYVAFQGNGKSPTFECRLDNVDWAEGAAALRAASWPRAPEFTQYRQFLTMRPSPTVNPEVREHLEAFARESAPAATAPTSPKKRAWWPFSR